MTLVMLPGSQEQPWALAVVYGMSLWTEVEESRSQCLEKGNTCLLYPEVLRSHPAVIHLQKHPVGFQSRSHELEEKTIR